MASSSIHRQESHRTLPPAKLQKLERLSLYYNLPEAAIIYTKYGFFVQVIEVAVLDTIFRAYISNQTEPYTQYVRIFL